MPEPQQFLAGFGLTSGKQVDGFTIKSASASHHVIRQYHEYSYDINLVLTKAAGQVGDVHTLLLALDLMTRGERQIMAIRNYYTCTIESPMESDVVVSGTEYQVHLRGHSYR